MEVPESNLLVSLRGMKEHCEAIAKHDEDWVQVVNGLDYSIGALKNILERPVEGGSSVETESPAETESPVEPDGSPGSPVVSKTSEES